MNQSLMIFSLISLKTFPKIKKRIMQGRDVETSIFIILYEVKM